MRDELYNIIKTDNGFMATSSNYDFQLIKKFYPEMCVIEFRLTKEEVKTKYPKIKFESFSA